MHKVAAQLAAAKELGLKAALLEETAAKAAKEAAILRKRQDAAHAMADEVLAGILSIGEPHSKADRRSAKSSGDRSGEGGEAGKTTSKRKATSDTTTSAKKVATPRVETYPVNLDERPKLEQFYLFPTDGFERSNYLEAVHRVPRRFASGEATGVGVVPRALAESRTAHSNSCFADRSDNTDEQRIHASSPVAPLRRARTVLRGGAIVGLARIMELPTKRGVHVIVRRLDVPASSRAGVKHHVCAISTAHT